MRKKNPKFMFFPASEAVRLQVRSDVQILNAADKK